MLGDSKPKVFATTHWSVVLAAQQPDARSAAALDNLCRAYWYPLYAFARCRATSRRMPGPGRRNSSRNTGAAAASMRRTRSAGVSGPFCWPRSKICCSTNGSGVAATNGAGREVFSLDEVDPEERYRLEPEDNASPDKLYERRWPRPSWRVSLKGCARNVTAMAPKGNGGSGCLRSSCSRRRALCPCRGGGAVGLVGCRRQGRGASFAQRYRDLSRGDRHLVSRPEDVGR